MDSTTGIVIILLSGVLVVIGSILIFRLHAFLALIAAALVVSALTPYSTQERQAIEAAAFPVKHVDEGTVSFSAGEKQGIAVGQQYLLLRFASRKFETVGTLQVEEVQAHSRALLTSSTTFATEDVTHLRVIHAHELRRLRKGLDVTIAQRVASGFGSMCGKIGILIAMAGIIGKCLLESGAADRIVRTTLRWFGERAAPAAFMTSGFVLGIPVFFDTVFYLMIPLGKAMRLRTGRNYLLYVLTIVGGATMAHSLVPPTPGPLVVAEELGVDLGTMILVGGAVGLCAVLFGYCYALILCRYCELPLRESPDFSLADLEQAMQLRDDELPPLWLSLTPILLPVILIAGHSILTHPKFPISFGDSTIQLIDTLGDKNIALIISAIVAMGTLVWQKRQSFSELANSVQAALMSAGVIILITAAGGAFGATLRDSGIVELVQELPTSSPVLLCTLAFLITTAIRTAQGSASVAMITAAGVLSSLAHSGELTFHPVYLAAAIGCGSKPLAWMNDSGFWVITRMSGMTEQEGLKYITPMTGAMGVIGLLAVLAGVTIYPNW